MLSNTFKCIQIHSYAFVSKYAIQTIAGDIPEGLTNTDQIKMDNHVQQIACAAQATALLLHCSAAMPHRLTCLNFLW